MPLLLLLLRDVLLLRAVRLLLLLLLPSHLASLCPAAAVPIARLAGGTLQ